MRLTEAREDFEKAVVERMAESGFLEIEVRVECLLRCGDGYQDEIINAGWHYWKAGRAILDQERGEDTLAGVKGETQ